ncbi:wee1-like protein kinase 1-A [Trichogramma pretiosum]|uniref:wee1-like protein kinase 1-A n=1 Tax=Trichogramma pretiosum TaxID=7493 RepID=UPI0006C978F1|nr:wee1-like protein kinase 1-A [Trichogramma pretiosum]
MQRDSIVTAINHQHRHYHHRLTPLEQQQPRHRLQNSHNHHYAVNNNNNNNNSHSHSSSSSHSSLSSGTGSSIIGGKDRSSSSNNSITRANDGVRAAVIPEEDVVALQQQQQQQEQQQQQQQERYRQQHHQEDHRCLLVVDNSSSKLDATTGSSSGCGDLLDTSSADDEMASSSFASSTSLVLQPRRLEFDGSMDLSDDEELILPRPTVCSGPIEIKSSNHEESQPKMACSPPYKRVRALRLFDSPATPKTLMEKSTMHTPIPTKCSRLFHNTDKPKPIPSGYYKHPEKPAVNINPFTPNGMLLTARKRTRSKRNLIGSPDKIVRKIDSELGDSEESEESEVEHPTKRVALQESNISRYYKEFLELELLGTGSFGSVFKCTHRLDGCNYAIKKSIKPVAGSVNEKNALNEVYAHAVLGKHQHVVRYYSAWAEDNHMIIQNEYCNGGSLADTIAKLRKENRSFSEGELRQLLLHIAEGLRYIHSLQLVHMDIKPGNIFISREKSQLRVNYDSADDGFDEEETEEEITYKIGDLGHVTSINNPQVEEGDCRYLPTEILREDFTHLTKADIFALGLTMYEAAGGGPLPKNGQEWHDIREGKLQELPQYSREFNELLKLMIHPNPEMRPSAVSLMQHRVLSPNGNKTKAQLRRELNAERLKNEILSKQLEEAAKCINTIAPNMVVTLNGNPIAIGAPLASFNTSGYRLRPTPTRTSSRAIGKKVNRSSSTTNF